MIGSMIIIPADNRTGSDVLADAVKSSIENFGLRVRSRRPVVRTSLRCNCRAGLMSCDREMEHHSLPLCLTCAETLLGGGRKDLLAEKIMSHCEEGSDEDDVLLVSGVEPGRYNDKFVDALNLEMSRYLGADILLAISSGGEELGELRREIELVKFRFHLDRDERLRGIVVVEASTVVEKFGGPHSGISKLLLRDRSGGIKCSPMISQDNALPVGIIHADLMSTKIRVSDVVKHFGGSAVLRSDECDRPVESVIFSISGMSDIPDHLSPNSLVVVPVYNLDVMLSIYLTGRCGDDVSAIMAVGDLGERSTLGRLTGRCEGKKLTVFSAGHNMWDVHAEMKDFLRNHSGRSPAGSKRLREHAVWSATIKSAVLGLKRRAADRSPQVFIHRLIQLAKRSPRTIILPEGEDVRILRAVDMCAKQRAARCILLGNPGKISKLSREEGIKLSEDVEIVDPEKIRGDYLSRLVDLRRDRGMSEETARLQLRSNVLLGTLMLEQSGEIDGLVSGVAHTTSETIRPALQIIGPALGCSLISSAFFMLLRDRIFLYSDCAVNINPTAEQLSEIALQSADSAISFGIEPVVAMLSYSTGESGSGDAVDKVRQATLMTRDKRPELIVDGPLQYDAATVEGIASLKSPASPVAGRASVIIFPDLNAGNITYKAVQRSTNTAAIGPILQGSRKPVSDLSRGASVEDILYTIVATAVLG